MRSKQSFEKKTVSTHYDIQYYNWQKEIGMFGGWANSYKFKKFISTTDTVIDFGCGGGFLLNNLACKNKIGIEPNLAATNSIKDFDIQHFYSPKEACEVLGTEFADIIISNNALEHTLNPLQELKDLNLLLKKGGAIHFVVPCDSISYEYNPKDINYHLFSWSPQNLGNLFTEAGYNVEFSKPYIHKWPPKYQKIARFGWPIFNIACRIYGRLERSWYQVEVRAFKI
ncbi:methyltransferase domain-containing protein [Kiloniella antarctica]|uniref:Methyltransferase domain-containing protein n=1 Tax=Kiloniella antarctica TaxID=1550907 RepID=A0ABW5BP45_9PROT